MSVLQVAAGRCYPPKIMVVDITSITDISTIQCQHQENHNASNQTSHLLSGVNLASIDNSLEWLQVLIQYLQKAGLKATLESSWAEIIQQLQDQSVDLLLVYLTEDKIQTEILLALEALRKLTVDLPPILVIVPTNHEVIEDGIDFNYNEKYQYTPQTEPCDLQIQSLPSIQANMGQIIAQFLSRSIPMGELINHIYQTLKIKK